MSLFSTAPASLLLRPSDLSPSNFKEAQLKAREMPKVPEISEADPPKVVKQPGNTAHEALPKGKEGGMAKRRWAVQVTSTRVPEEARLYKERLVSAGFPAYTIPTNVNGKAWIRVRVGFFMSREEAEKVGGKIQRKGVISQGPCWITKVSAKEKENLLGN